MKQLALVVGAGGQLGEALAMGLSARHEIVALTRNDLDVTDTAQVQTTVGAVCPDVVINCAAFTDVDRAEANPVAALAINASAVRALARAAATIDATFVHYSTDFVFDGHANQPYGEDAAPNPRSVYAASKLLGEWFARDAPRHYVLRVESLFGGVQPRSSIDRILQNIRGGTPVRAFVDRTVSPSFIEDVVAATAALVSAEPEPGIYHCVNSGWTTWSALARELARLSGRPNAPIVDVLMADAKLVAERPRFAALSNAKLTAAGIPMPTWQDALARYVSAGADL